MKYKGNEKLVIYVITYGPKSTRSPLELQPHLKQLPPPYNFKKAQSPLEKIPLQNSSSSPPPTISGGSYPDGSSKSASLHS